ncbi:MAG: right-handed parallel beta-helix repeat-containing protein, partial [Candidatus Micrarchaeota archaeon]
TDAESASYNESLFELWKYNSSSSWTMLNDTPNTTSNTFSLTNMNPASTYGILEQNETCPIISESGTNYVQSTDYVGAPNYALPLSGFACVVIAASNVTFDCNGFNITYDNSQSGSDTYGILLNGSIKNVTVKNCPRVHNYSTSGMMFYQSNDSVVTNSTFFNNTNGVSLFGGYRNNLTALNITNSSADGIFANLSNNVLIDPTEIMDNEANGINLNNLNDSVVTNVTVNDNKGHGLQLVQVERTIIENSTFCYNHQYGVKLHHTIGVNFTNIDVCNNTIHGMGSDDGQYTKVYSSRIFNNTQYGVYLETSDNNNFSGTNITRNVVGGIRFDAGSDTGALSNDYVCWNGLDINNLGASNAGSLDRCDSWLTWSENGHYGCEYSCSSLWHRFFGDTNGTIVLGNTTYNIYSWIAQNGLNIYFTDFDSVISWGQLQAIGRNTTNQSSSSDFTELDAAFSSGSFTDSISSTYSTDGTSPKETKNYTIFGRAINYIPVSNSTSYNTTFKTGILWDKSDGGAEYTNAVNQSTVWMTKINASADDSYGAYDFLTQIPYTLSTQEGANDEVAIYLELQ